MKSTEKTHHKKNNLKLWLILSTIFWSILLVASLLPITMAFIIFTTPSPTTTLFTQFAAIAILTFPLSIITSVIGSWIFYKKKKSKPAFIFMGLPFLSLILIVISFYLIQLNVTPS